MIHWSTFTSNKMNLLDKINIKTFKINNIKKYYNEVIKTYKTLDNITVSDFRTYFLNDGKDIPNTSTHKSYLLYILLELHNKYSDILDSIYLNNNFTETEIDTTKKFISKLNTHKFKYCVCWLNQYGTKLANGIYNLISLNKLPKSIKKNIVIKTPDIYGQFTSLDLQRYIETYINYGYYYLVNHKGVTLKLYIHTNKCYKIKNYKNIIKRCLILGVLHKKSIKLKINLWFTNMRKELPKEYKILGPKEINSGSSSSFTGISIWRLEECNKLLIHETIHALDLDFRSKPDKLSIVCDTHNVGNSTIKFFEAYTETWSCILNCILCSYEKNNTENEILFMKLIEYERKFTCYQLAKILNFFNFANMKDFKSSCDSQNRFKQSTSVFSYFFIKGTFLYYLDDFLQYFIDENINIMDHGSRSPDKLYELFLTLSKRKEMDMDVDNLLNKFNGKFDNSLRMTCIELENKN